MILFPVLPNQHSYPMTQNKKDEKDPKKDQQKGAIQPDPETLHTTDPQDHMKGPVSSLVNKTKETIEDEGGKHTDTGKEEDD